MGKQSAEVTINKPKSTSLYIIISQLWLTFHPKSTVVLLDTGTPGTSRDIYSEHVNDTNSQPLGYKPNALVTELYSSSYCWEGVEFIQLVYCIIYLSFLNCG